MKIRANTAKEASQKYCELRDRSGRGASTFPFGHWYDCRISYNGRVWDINNNLIYCPSEEFNNS